MAFGPAATAGEIFSDSFESGGTDAWSASVPPVPPPRILRFSDLDLRDPHLFVDVVVLGCSDFTDNALVGGLVPSFNESIEMQINGDSEPDGLLDLSSLLVFRPLDPLAIDSRVDLVGGVCTAPVETTSCMPDPLQTEVELTYDSAQVGTCLEAVAGSLGGYVPGVPEPLAPCFSTREIDLTLEINGVMLPLVDARVGASWDGSPVDGLVDGLLLGFVREADAAMVTLPAELPLVGGQPLSVLLPGGAGNCVPPPGDLDMHEGEPGWWFYLEFSAELVPFG